MKFAYIDIGLALEEYAIDNRIEIVQQYMFYSLKTK